MGKTTISQNAYSTIYLHEGPPGYIEKELNQDFPDRRALRRLDNEYEILQTLQKEHVEGVRKVRGKGKQGARHYLLFDYFEGLTLKEFFTKEQQPVEIFLQVAIALTTILHNIHQAGIIHRDVTGGNLLVNPNDLSVYIIDFELSTRMDLKHLYLGNPNKLEGTLAYISPEQTGRINRIVDHRSDLYSLGVVFYQALTGKVPFQANDALELVHAIIARIPDPPSSHASHIPKVLSDLVMKLLEKNAEDRYTSAYGLRRDLEKSLELLSAEGHIESFPLGQEDHSARFQIPDKLYGRDKETERLLNAFDRASQGTLELMLVSGYSGTGKTALISEIHGSVFRKRGYFIDGKFDQFKRNIPYYALIRALEQFIELLLTEEEAFQSWAEKLQAAVGSEGGVLIEVLPSLKRLIGPQPPVPELAGKEAQNRFNYVFRNFVKAISRQEHPLVLFIDDLQWADLSSLALLRLLATDPENKYFLCICAYRDNEVSASHPFIQTAQELEERGVSISRIHLENLSIQHVNELIADALLTTNEEAQALTALVYEKTQGNAFFLRQFLKSLYENDYLVYHFDEVRWHWEVGHIRSLNMTDNVVELLSNKIQKLSSNLRKMLQLAACIGDRFERNTLSLVFEGSEDELNKLLEKAQLEGLLLPITEETLRFTHDRVQQASYSLLPVEQLPALHLKIGRLFLDNIPEQERQEHLFDIVNQLNWGIDLIESPQEREALAQLNLQAGRKARESAAYAPAQEYLSTGIALLPEKRWESHYALTLSLHTEAAEACYLGAKFDQMDLFIEEVIQNAQELLDKVKVFETRILAFKARNLLVEAIQTGLSFLEALGVTFPENPTPEDTAQALQDIMLLLKDYTTEQLLQLPEMTDPSMQSVMAILADINSSVYWARAELFPFIVFKTVELSVKYGNSPVSSFAYSTYGVVLSGAVGDMRTAFQYGELGMKLIERFQALEWLTSTVCAHYVLIVPWNSHLRTAFEPLVESVHRGLEIGNNEYAAINANNYLIMSFSAGTPLESLAEELESYSTMMLEYKQETNYRFNQIYLQATQNLQGWSQDPCKLVGEAYDEREMLPIHLEAKDHTATFLVYFQKMMLNYLFGKIDDAEHARQKASEKLSAILAKTENATFRLYDSLILLAQYPKASSERKEKIRLHVEQNQELMDSWAKAAPMNFRHKHALVEAEYSRALGKTEQAHELYERAAQLANLHDYLNEEALAYELTGKFCLEKGLPIFGHRYLHKAYKVYRQWEAHAKAKQLLQAFPKILSSEDQQEPQQASGTWSNTSYVTTTSQGLNIDLDSLTKAARAISQEIDLDALLEVALRLIIENAGADRGLLILSQGGEKRVEIEADTTGRCIRPKLPLHRYEQIPRSVTQYALRTLKVVLLDNATTTAPYHRDVYIQKVQPRSILCYPMLLHNEVKGIVYLENQATSGAFTLNRVQIVQTLLAQAVISLENAGLYASLEEKVQERTQELTDALDKLKRTQTKLVQSEKMASLGTLVAGVAHEINNPVNFTYNAAYSAQLETDKLEELLRELTGGQKEAMELFESHLNPIHQALLTVVEGSKRIKGIVAGLRTFSRIDETDSKEANVIEGLRATLLLLEGTYRNKVDFVTDFQAEPVFECWPGQLNQVFMNVMVNACQAIIEKGESGTLTIRSSLREDWLVLTFEDTGVGIPKELQEKVFEPFFTTKEVGQGTGLGMSISYGIIEKHNGHISIQSEVDKGTTVTIELPFRHNQV